MEEREKSTSEMKNPVLKKKFEADLTKLKDELAQKRSELASLG